jgi:hypothetical protein
MRKLLTLPLILMLSSTAFAQGFPWEIFKARTLKEVISITTKAVKPDDSMFLANNQLESKVEVTLYWTIPSNHRVPEDFHQNVGWNASR